ncbi:MAG: YihY/virulence factor BrkB family protein [Terriglobales bacterium]
MASATPPPSAELAHAVGPVAELWRHRWREAWRLIRATAKLLGPSAQFLTTIEAHTYAYSVAANLLLAFLPFMLLMVWLSRQMAPLDFVLSVVSQFVQIYLPTGGGVIMRDITYLASQQTARIFSVIMLAVTSTGVFLPLEVALNGIWGFKKNRGYLRNQAMSLWVVAICGGLGVVSIQLAVLGQRAVNWITPGHWWLPNFLDFCVLKSFAFPTAILGFFFIYWLLPNGKISPERVFPAALYAGILAEIFETVFRWTLPLLDVRKVYASLALPVTLIVWGYAGALLLLFGASLSARGVAKLPHLHLRPHAAHATHAHH